MPYLCYTLCQTFYIYYFISFYNFITPPQKSYYYSHFYKREIIADIAVPLLKSNLSSISSLSPAMTPSAHRNIHRRKVIKWKTFFFFFWFHSSYITRVAHGLLELFHLPNEVAEYVLKSLPREQTNNKQTEL